MDTSPFKIIIGNPAVMPASYSRFVLPFAYNLEKINDEEKNQFHYVPENDPDKIWRERYLTEETADVLFYRAKWFTMKGKDEKWNQIFDMTICENDCQKKTVKVCMSPPSIVLFECPSNHDKKERENRNILQTGFLIVELYFSEEQQVNIDDLLRLNELFRYWRQPFAGHENNCRGYQTVFGDFPISFFSKEKIKDSALPDMYFEKWASLLEIPIFDGKNHYRLFPDEWSRQATSKVSENVSEIGKPPGWLIYSDNRTFVWTCAIMEKGGDALRDSFFKPGDRRAAEFGHWIKLLNVDSPGKNDQDTHESTRFERKWADERTYKRWEESGTFYGFSYHSSAMMGPPFKDPPLWKHFGQMYFDQVLLLLYLRVSLFRFSVELNKISGKARDTETEKGEETWESDFNKHFNKLRWEFTLFTNLYQFPLLSNQQQAVEMYTIARKSLDVDELFDEIEKEIHSSHDYLVIQKEQEQTKSIVRLTVVATIGMTLTMDMSFLGYSKGRG